jgi:hypothetical protein
MRTFSQICFAALFLALGPVGCGRKCQPAETQSFTTITATPWRLAESTDPTVSASLTNFNFLIVSFNKNNTGDIKRVVDNDQYDQPVQTLVWVPDVANRILRVQYTSTGSTTSGDAGTFDYQYSLGRQLEMFDSKKGYYYRYVPFKGVVDPDVLCTF